MTLHELGIVPEAAAAYMRLLLAAQDSTQSRMRMLTRKRVPLLLCALRKPVFLLSGFPLFSIPGAGEDGGIRHGIFGQAGPGTLCHSRGRGLTKQEKEYQT